MRKKIVRFNQWFDKIEPEYMRFMLLFIMVSPLFIVQAYPVNGYIFAFAFLYAIVLMGTRLWYLKTDHGDLNEH